MKRLLYPALLALVCASCGGAANRPSDSDTAGQVAGQAVACAAEASAVPAPGQASAAIAGTAEEEVSADCVQVLYFHTRKRCATCNAIERLTREVVDSISSGKVVMRVIDLTREEALADKYQVSWSSLVLDRGGKTENLTKMGFSYARTDPGRFKARLTEAITRISE